MSTQHTPTLRYVRLNGTAADFDIVNEHGGRVASTPYEQHAARIVRACNSHEQLVALVERYASECGECGGKGYYFEGEAITGRGPDDVFPEQVACPECADIRAALAAAKGEA